ncbi:hypothetical protein [Sciscionella marina]|uniref:hypothetical protein n=1 Tax=Sciscionella marina TaxID=508770 RepID=UPI000399C48C|nr:hypothetical protein [Sciscionella marina]
MSSSPVSSNALTGGSFDLVSDRAAQTVYHARLMALEEQAIARLAEQAGPCRADLVPGSAVIQVVCCDGAYVGRIRRETDPAGRRRWRIVPPRPLRSTKTYPNSQTAALALAALSHTARKAG